MVSSSLDGQIVFPASSRGLHMSSFCEPTRHLIGGFSLDYVLYFIVREIELEF